MIAASSVNILHFILIQHYKKKKEKNAQIFPYDKNV